MCRRNGWRYGVGVLVAGFSLTLFLSYTSSDAAAEPPPVYYVEIAPPLTGHDSVFPTGITAAGMVVGIAGTAPWDALATPVLYGRGRLLALPKPNESFNFALGVGSLGTIVGASRNAPAVWVRGVPAPLQLPFFAEGFANDANVSGVIVGTVFDFTGLHLPVFWPSAGAPGGLLPGLPGIQEGVAHAINERGQIGGFIGGQTGFLGVRWGGPRQTPVPIGPLPGGTNSEVIDLNSRGDAVGRSAFEDNTVEAMLYVEETATLLGLGFLDGPYSIALGINDARQVVGNASVGEVLHAFLWQDSVLHDLNELVVSSSEPFDYLANAVAIDQNGRIAAEAVVPGPFAPATRIAILHPLAP